MSSIKRVDLVTGLGLCALAVYVYYEASGMPAVRRGLGPGGYPKFVAGGLFVLGAVMAVQTFFQSAAPAARKYTAAKLGRVVLFAVLCLAYALAMRPLGFLLSSILYLVAAINFFGYRKHWMTILFSIGLSATVYGIFRHVFLVLLPTGTLF